MAEELDVLPREYTWLIELCLLIYMLYTIYNKNSRIKSFKLFYYFLVIAIIGLLGLVLHEGLSIKYLYGIRHYFKYAILAVLIRSNGISNIRYNNIIWLILVLISIQPVIGIVQYIIIGQGRPDLIFGSIRDTGFLSVLYTWFVIILIDLQESKGISRFTFILLILMMTAHSIIGEMKAFYIFVPVGLLVKYYYKIFSVKRVLWVFTLLGVLFLAGNYFTNYHTVDLDDFVEVVQFPDNLIAKVAVESSGVITTNNTFERSIGTRYASIVYSIRNLISDPKTLFFGRGIGSVTLTYGDIWYNISGMKRLLYATSFSSLITSLGVIGFALFISVIIRPSKRQVLNSFGLSKIISSNYVAISTIFILSLFYANTFSDPISYVFWMFYLSLFVINK